MKRVAALLGLCIVVLLLVGTAPALGQATDGEAAVPPGVDLNVTYISREPRYDWWADKQWPLPGEVVTFTAHVINKGTTTSGPFAFEWIVDGVAVDSGMAPALAPQAETVEVLTWAWKTGRHHVGFVVDRENLIPETSETNNMVEDATDALAIAFWVEESVYDEFNSNQNGAGTFSWEDWAQRILGQMNGMFERSAYERAATGVVTRVRLDKVTISPDGTLFDLGYSHAPYEGTSDAQWGFSLEEYQNCSEQCYDVPWWVIHELGHYLLGLIDLYAFDVQGGDVHVLDEFGNPVAGTPELPYIAWDVVHYTSRLYDVMHVPDPYSIFSDYSAYYLNQAYPMAERHHEWWQLFLDVPAETRLRVLDNEGQPMAGVEVSVFQAVTGDGSSGPYSQNFDNIADIVGVTDAQGQVSLGGAPFGDLNAIGTPAGVVLIRLEDPPSGELGYVWLELIDVNLAYWRGEDQLYVHDAVFPIGPKRLWLSRTELVFNGFAGASPRPQSVEVSVLGEGVEYWSVSESNVNWMRTIPAPDIAISYSEYPAGPLTVIIDSRELSPGVYTGEVIVDAGPEVLDSPQTLTVTLSVVEPKRVFLPFALRSQVP